MSRLSISLIVPFLLAALVFAGSAHAGTVKEGGFTYVTSKKVTIKPSKKATVKATCPGKTHVLAGSSVTNAPYNSVTTSIGIPFDGGDNGKVPDDGWRGQASSYYAGKIKLTAEAVCSTIKPKYVVDSVKTDPNAQTNTSVACTSGNAIAGGMLGDVGTNSNYPVDANWVQYADNFRGEIRKVEVAAVCVTSDFDVSTSASSVTGTTSTQGFLSCGSGQVGINFGQSNSVDHFMLNTVSGSAFPSGASYQLDSYTADSKNYLAYLICSDPLR